MRTNRIAVITQDRAAATSFVTALPSATFSTEVRLVQPTSQAQDLLDLLLELTGVSDGSIPIDAVVMDAVFQIGSGAYFILDNLRADLPGSAGSALSILEGAGIPVLVNFSSSDITQAWSLGAAASGRLESANTLPSALIAVLAQRKFDPRTLEVENDFAQRYDEIELGGAATVSAMLSENEFVMSQVRAHAKSSTGLRVLDLGCGTGRFEELLLTDSDLSKKIIELHAVDFAPRYLGKARERLEHFVEETISKKISYHRRIAEDSRLPDDYFDVVIASFGIVCFSRFHLTLPELHRMLKPGGLVVLNGYNREALTYEFDRLMVLKTGQRASHFAIHIDREENTMHLGDHQIRCFTFHLEDLAGMLKLVGLRPIKDSGRTFPALYGAARKTYLQRIRTKPEVSADAHARGTCRHAGECSSFHSYQSVNLKLDPGNSGFDETFHSMDEDLSALLPSRGYYFCLAAHKLR